MNRASLVERSIRLEAKGVVLSGDPTVSPQHIGAEES
jgi:hypothetical protein